MSREARFSSRMCDLNLDVETDGFQITSNTKVHSGFGYMWGGCFCDHGVLSGNGGFEVKILEHLKFDDSNAIVEEANLSSICRFGWTVQSALKDKLYFGLGENMNSFAFCSSGYKVENANNEKYGASFKVGDIIGCWISKIGTNVLIKFTLNGDDLGTAWSLKMEETLCFIPHLFIKNTKVEVNFGQQQYPWHTPPDTFYLLNQPEVNCRLIKNPRVQVNILTVFIGLPGAGKTTWLTTLLPELCENRPKPIILGTDIILEQMKLIGASKYRDVNVKIEKYTSLATECITYMLKKAIKFHLDVIVDQPNILPAERRKKYVEFQRSGYYCQAMVVVPEEDLRCDRAAKRVMSTGKPVPDELLKKMKANFYIPQQNDGVFNKVRHLELDEEKSLAVTERYNKEYKDYVCKAPVVDLTEDRNTSSNDRRVTPPRRKSRSRDRSRDKPRRRKSRSRDRRKSRSNSRARHGDGRRSRSPPRGRRRPRSPSPPRHSPGRHRNGFRGGSHNNGWNPENRNQPRNPWGDDPYGFNAGSMKANQHDDLSEYGFTPAPPAPPTIRNNNAKYREQQTSGWHKEDHGLDSARSNQVWPGYNGRVPEGLERVAQINIEALRAIDVWERENRHFQPRAENSSPTRPIRDRSHDNRREDRRDEHRRHDYYDRANYEGERRQHEESRHLPFNERPDPSMGSRGGPSRHESDRHEKPKEPSSFDLRQRIGDTKVSDQCERGQHSGSSEYMGAHLYEQRNKYNYKSSGLLSNGKDYGSNPGSNVPEKIYGASSRDIYQKELPSKNMHSTAPPYVKRGCPDIEEAAITRTNDEDYRVTRQDSIRNNVGDRSSAGSVDQRKKDDYVPSTIDKYLKSSMSKDEVLAKLKQDLFKTESVAPKPPVEPETPVESAPRIEEPSKAPSGRMFGLSNPVATSPTVPIPTVPSVPGPRPGEAVEYPFFPSDIKLPAHLPPELAEAVKTAQQYPSRGPPASYGFDQPRGYDDRHMNRSRYMRNPYVPEFGRDVIYRNGSDYGRRGKRDY